MNRCRPSRRRTTGYSIGPSTVGKAGKRVEVDLYLGGIGSSTFEIWPTGGGVPLSIPTTPLLSSTLNFTTGSTQIKNFVPWDVSSAGIQVQVGDKLAIVQNGGSHIGTGSWWAGADNYAAGAAYTTTTTAVTGPWNDLNRDFGFRTYIEGVPEPTGLATLALGWYGLTSLRRRKSV